jgi:hypothetical protein
MATQELSTSVSIAAAQQRFIVSEQHISAQCVTKTGKEHKLDLIRHTDLTVISPDIRQMGRRRST